MAIDPIESAIDALIAHFSTLTVAWKGSTASLRVERGWTEGNTAFDFEDGPVLTLTHLSERREEHTPEPTAEGPTVTWNVADLTILVQMDLWSPYREVHDDAALAVREALHDDLPYRVGLHLTSDDYYDQEITVHTSEGRNLPTSEGPQVGEWRRMWELTVSAAEVREIDMPQQETWQLDTVVNDVVQDSFVIDPS